MPAWRKSPRPRTTPHWDASRYSAAAIGDDRVRAVAFARLGRSPAGGSGGGSQADFDSLINLITSTIRPQSWDTVGGPGSISPFPTGVWIDSHGLLQPLLKDDRGSNLEALRAANSPSATANKSVRREANLRKISLTRLEKQIQLLQAAGRPLPEEMQVLAGLQRIQYVFVYPDSGDLVLAGPAGDWVVGGDGTVLTARAAVRRFGWTIWWSFFGRCSAIPRPASAAG